MAINARLSERFLGFQVGKYGIKTKHLNMPMKTTELNTSRLYRLCDHLFARIALSSLISLLIGCTPLKQYRTSYPPYPPGQTARPAAHTNALELTDDYLLGFVEFDDHGWLWDANQMRRVVDRIADEDKSQALLIVVFAHGWKHNASWDDGNVASFRGVLKELHEVEVAGAAPGSPPRKVVGLYLGWRGLSQQLPVLKEFTFWERKRTAHAVGQGAVSELMAELDKVRKRSRAEHKDEEQQKKRQPTMLIVVGHSFGGALVYSGIAPLLQERLVDNLDDAGHDRQPRGFGDLVVLINPAFEAARFEILKRTSDTLHYGTHQAASLAIFTSKADWATKIAFKIGRMISTIFEKNRDHTQYWANVTAVGHYTPYITHDLNAKKPTATNNPAVKMTKTQQNQQKIIQTRGQSAENVQKLRAQVHQNRAKPKESVTAEDSTFDFGASILVPRKTHVAHDPIYVVSVDKRIIPSHDDIERPEFITFLREFILAFSANPQTP